MKNCDVDKLAIALGSLASAAQKRMSDDRNRLSATIDIDTQGMPKYVNWQCKVPSGDGRERQHSLLKIPWESFYTDEPMSITEISVEFGCTVRKRIEEDSSDHYILKPAKHASYSSENGKVQKSGDVFKLSLTAENDFAPEMLLNEQDIEEYFEAHEDGNTKKSQVLHRVRIYLNKAINQLKRFIFRL